MEKQYYIYILANKPFGTLYTGVTSNLIKRIWEHKGKVVDGFTKKYNLDKLVYFETCTNPKTAIEREKKIKKWRRDWKIDLVNGMNPEWKDLYSDLIDPGSSPG